MVGNHRELAIGDHTVELVAQERLVTAGEEHRIGNATRPQVPREPLGIVTVVGDDQPARIGSGRAQSLIAPRVRRSSASSGASASAP